MQEFLCKENFSFKMREPYFHFSEGKLYNFIVSIRGDIGNIIIYESVDCPLYVTSHKNFSRNFYTIEELRDIKINKILTR